MASATQELQNSQLTNLLQVQQLAVNYGAVCALEDASLEVHAGEIVAMIGPNGAGKSTALRAIAGILPHYDGRIAAGEVRFAGQLINNLPPHKLIHSGLSLVPENRHVFSSMTVQENLEMGAYSGVGELMSRGVHECRSRRQWVAERMEYVYNLFPVLKERRRQRAGTLSTGEQQMLAMGRGMMVSPKLLLVDEPTVGLSPNYVDVVFDTLVAINEGGTSILLVEQNARCALEISHRAYVFEIGRIALSGDSKSLSEDPRIKKAYLGA
jgi:branched-chain amino acid transport system ATP-binding protein